MAPFTAPESKIWRSGVIFFVACAARAQGSSVAEHYTFLFLNSQAVRRDMGIAPLVGKKLDAIIAVYRKQYGPVIGRKHGTRLALDVGAATKDRNKAELELLTSGQRQRLRELSLQSGGPSNLER